MNNGPFSRILGTSPAPGNGGATASTQKWDARFSHPVPHDNLYYAKCVVGGIISCGLTHTAIVPLDVVKVNMQVDPDKFKGLISGTRVVMSEGGMGALTKGWVPTFIGYSLQGAGKFGFYEIFKDLYSNMLGEEKSYQYRGFVYAAASGSAEFFADIMLCPMEMVKVRRTMKQFDSFSTVKSCVLRWHIIIFSLPCPITLGQGANVTRWYVSDGFWPGSRSNASEQGRNALPLWELGAIVGPSNSLYHCQVFLF